MSVGPRLAVPLLLLAVVVGVTAAGTAVGSSSGHAVEGGHPQVTDPETGAGNLTIVIDVQSNGDARFTVSTDFVLRTNAEREAFRSLAESFESGETSTLGLEAFRQARREASQRTGRRMEIVNVTRHSSPDATVENGTGRLSVQFTWTNFAQTDGDRLVVDDVFGTESTWLPGLDRGDRLMIMAPAGYGVVDSNVAPEVRNNQSTLRWVGPENFDADTLRAVFTGQGNLGNGSETPSGQDDSLLWGFGLLLIGIAVVYLLVRRGDIAFPSPDEDDESPVATEPEREPTSEGGAEPTEAESTGETAETSEIDEELLSDEERVERLLEENGGRMKQAHIVQETGWSNAKVSQLLSAMEDDGRIDKLRIGRENLISFPDEDVADLEE